MGNSGESMLKSIEQTSTVLGEIPRSILPGELGKRDHDVRVVKDEQDWMSFTFHGSGQLEMVWILSGDIVKPC